MSAQETSVTYTNEDGIKSKIVLGSEHIHMVEEWLDPYTKRSGYYVDKYNFYNELYETTAVEWLSTIRVGEPYYG